LLDFGGVVIIISLYNKILKIQKLQDKILCTKILTIMSWK
jgi:hypothetical protein